MHLPIRIVVGALAACLTCASQYFWFRRGWRIATSFQDGKRKRMLQVGWCAGLCLVFLAVMDGLPFQTLPRTGGGAWLRPLLDWWLFASLASFICMNALGLVVWSWVNLPAATKSLFARTPIDAQPEFTNTSRRHFLSTAMSVVGTLPFIASSYGALLERTNFVVRHVGVSLRRLPDRLHGLRIIQISDIHLSETLSVRELRRAVRIANDLHGDLVVITGDFITYRDDSLSQCVSELSKLHAPLGVWGVQR
jgi:hypothetical protein